ncbi:MAG: lytic transglycosylase domain-containing protein [Arcobacteraceae bacterium]|nr:lytic transglycosylase domain-containing protein [Arcobacteraceae bacterium]
MFKLIFIFFIFIVNLHAEERITKEWLNEKPKNYVKDFYLWRYMEQNKNNDNDIIWALSEANNANHKIFFKYTKPSKKDPSNIVVNCLNLTTSELIKTDGECINIGLSILEATNLRGEQLSVVIDKIKKEYQNKNEKLNIINSKDPFESLINSSSNEVFFGTFNEVGENFRIQYFNAQLPQKLVSKLQDDKQKFKKMIKTIITTPQITTIQQSLFDVDTKNLAYQDIFFLAMNAIKHDRKNVALKYLENAKAKAYFKFDQDNVSFWQYKLTNDKKYVDELGASWDINIYSVLAKEELNITIDNAFFDFNVTENNNSTFDPQDPFLWRSVLDDIKVDFNETKLEKYKSIFNTKETLGHLTVLEEKYNKQRVGYFPNPFEEYIKDYSLHRQALINALARQESRFVQASLSSSYAMGVMQIMPFLSEVIAKELNEPYDIFMQLDPKTNIRYANHHLNYLESKLANVLFVAYAYNGGIGFTNRMLQSGLFKQGPYEPFLSMELINYDESKVYGKKVLLNYLMYYNHQSKEKIKLSTLLETIKSPYLDLGLSTPVKEN